MITDAARETSQTLHEERDPASMESRQEEKGSSDKDREVLSWQQYLLIYTALLGACFMCASAAVVFAHLRNGSLQVPAYWAANWRLGWVQVIQTPMWMWSVLKKQGAAPSQKKTYLQALPLIALSGICLGVHFAAWVVAIELTSLTHSLLFVSMGPILLQGVNWIQFAFFNVTGRGYTVQRPSIMATIGTLIGLIASLILMNDVIADESEDKKESDGAIKSPTWYGDLIAVLGAATVAVYLVIGRHLQAPPYSLNLWTYSYGVVGTSYMTTLVLALLLAEDSFSTSAKKWLTGLFEGPYIGFAFYLGIGPGLLGHVLLNYLLQYLSPLTISTAMLTEPVLGGVLGYVLGLQHFPGLWTWIGGSLLLVGLVLVLRAEHTVHQVESIDDNDLNKEREEDEAIEDSVEQR